MGRWFTDLTRDIIFAARMLRQQPGFAAAAVLSTALGIGSCSTVFSVANFALFRPLPVEQPSRLMNISGRYMRGIGPIRPLSLPGIQDLGKAPAFAATAAFFPYLPAGIRWSGGSQRAWGAMTSANYFDVVRPKFLLGGGFDSSQDDAPGAAPKVVLSYDLWKTRFGADPAILGKNIEINKGRATVVGVTAAGFRGIQAAIVSEFWVPFSMFRNFAPSIKIVTGPAGALPVDRKDQWLWGVGRLRANTVTRQAIAEADVIAKRLSSQSPDPAKAVGFHIERAGRIDISWRGIFQNFFWLVFGIAALVLLIACANVANLLLARASARHREIATRLAMGAGRGRLIRQLLTESVLLSLLGGAGGYLLAAWAVANSGNIQLPTSYPLDLAVPFDFRVVLFCAVLSMLVGIAFGLVPALQAARTGLLRGLSDRSVTVSGLGRFGLRNLLVVAQVAICMVLLTCSGLFLRSLDSSQRIQVGMDRNVLLLSFDPALNHYSEAQTRQFVRSLLEGVKALPGIAAASVTDTVPLTASVGGDQFTPESNKVAGAAGKVIEADSYGVAPGFFETLGIAFVQGRDFKPGAAADNNAVILNQAAARKAFPQQNPLGRAIFVNARKLQIVGIVATAKSETIGERPQPCFYVPLLAEPGSSGDLIGLTLLVGTRGAPASFATPVRDVINRLDSSLPVFDVHTMDTHLANALTGPRLAALLFGLCGIMGLVISAIGIYGVVSFAVVTRTREIGIRTALGARRAQILKMICKQGLGLAAAGCVIGSAAALAISRWTATMLYGIGAHDPVTFALVPAFLLVVALAACIVPARRAASVDPAHTLRHQ